MPDFIRLVGANQVVEVFGVRLVGVNADTGVKLLVSIGFLLVVVGTSRLLQRVARGPRDIGDRSAFWVRQGIRLASALVLVLGLVSIWFDQPARLATGLGLMSAGLAFALQRVITAIAGYFVILRGDIFNVGDRITMGGVREVKDAMSREILDRLDEVAITIPSQSFEMLFAVMNAWLGYRAERARAGFRSLRGELQGSRHLTRCR